MKKTYYIHTLEGLPAEFSGQQIVFASFFGKSNKLCRDLKQIRKEQRLSEKWRAQQGWSNRRNVDDMSIGYRRYETP